MSDITIVVGSTMNAKRLATALAFGDALQHDRFIIRTVCLDVEPLKNAFSNCFARAKAIKPFAKSDFTISFGDEMVCISGKTYVRTVVQMTGPAQFPTIASSRLTVPSEINWEIEEGDSQHGFVRSLKIGLYREAINSALTPHLKNLA